MQTDLGFFSTYKCLRLLEYWFYTTNTLWSTGRNFCDPSSWTFGCNGRDCWLFRKPCVTGVTLLVIIAYQTTLMSWSPFSGYCVSTSLNLNSFSFQQMPIREACHVAIQRIHPSKHRLWKHAQARQQARGQNLTPVLQIVSASFGVCFVFFQYFFRKKYDFSSPLG